MPSGEAADKPDYGIDAPGVIRNLFLFGALCLGVGLFAPSQLPLGAHVTLDTRSLLWAAAFLFAPGVLMLLYALHGKFRHRDRMLALHNWRGDERVLDVGTGRGLLLVGAARRLTSGHAVGLDIWKKADLSANSRERTERNLAIEAVGERCTLVSEAAQQMSFADASFDVVLSNLCLHNIYDGATRRRAVAEIARVLRPAGVAIISDFKHTRAYARQLRAAGLHVEHQAAQWLRTFPPLAIVIARKR
jgi:arsenite methyltransferase